MLHVVMLAMCEFGKDNMKGNISWTKENWVSLKKKKKSLSIYPKKKEKEKEKENWGSIVHSIV